MKALKFPPRDDDSRNTESLELPPLLVRVSDGNTTALVQMPLEVALFMVRHRLCQVAGDLNLQPDILIDDEAVDLVFAAGGIR